MYATTADMIARFDRPENPELTQLIPVADTTPAEVDTRRLAVVLAEASGEMDAYLGSRNSLPLSGIGADQAANLSRICCDIARYRLWDDRASDEVRRRYDDALKFLQGVASGTILLSASGTGGTTSIAQATLDAQPRALTRDTLRGVI